MDTEQNSKKPLSVRERQLLPLVVLGLSSAEMSLQLKIRRNTVKKHLRSIFGKMGVSYPAELIPVAREYITHHRRRAPSAILSAHLGRPITLTPRQEDVLEFIGHHGKTPDKCIAEGLEVRIAEETARWHVIGIKDATGVRNRIELKRLYREAKANAQQKDGPGLKNFSDTSILDARQYSDLKHIGGIAVSEGSDTTVKPEAAQEIKKLDLFVQVGSERVALTLAISPGGKAEGLFSDAALEMIARYSGMTVNSISCTSAGLKMRKSDDWKKPPKKSTPVLLVREQEIVFLIAQGYKNKEIAKELCIAEQTVKNHLREVFRKLGLKDRLELALYAIDKGLHLPPENSRFCPSPLERVAGAMIRQGITAPGSAITMGDS